MKYSTRIGLVGALVIFSKIVLAYEIDTHEKMSESAAKSSILKTDNEVLRRLGLQLSIEDNRQQFPNSKSEPRNILNLIKEGSKFEDNNIRPLNHFYDPLRDEGLLFFTSPTWALEDKGKIHLLQNYSFSDARNYLYRALTLSDGQERKRYFGKTFESLGRIIHHL